MRIKTENIIKYLSALLIFLSVSCSAPHDNPLDPANNGADLGTLEGIVKTVSYPNSPVGGVTVSWPVGNIVVQTNSAGYFKIQNVKQTDGWVILSNEKFSTDSIFVNWNGRKKKSINVFLNAKPYLDSLELYSIVIHKYQFNQTNEMFVNARIYDPDGENDIDSVFVESASLNVKKTLEYNSASKFYERTLTPLDLNITFIDEAIGKNFNIVVRDLSGKLFTVGTANIKRVIKEEIEPLSPLNSQESTVPFTIKWKRFTPGFNFKYMVQISTNQTPAELVWEKKDISPDDISIEITDSLQSGEYFWVIWCIDEFQNRSRSKPATFIIN